MIVWYSFGSFDIFFPFWYYWTKKNLATLFHSRLRYLLHRNVHSVPGRCYKTHFEPNLILKAARQIDQIDLIFFSGEKECPSLEQIFCEGAFFVH
jgi:hypothetical protein